MDCTPEWRNVVAAVARGDTAAQYQLYKRSFPYGLNVALHYCSHRQEAEEVLQDAFVKAFRHLESKGAVTHFKPWFRRVIINTAIDAGRRKKSVWDHANLLLPQPATNLAEQELNTQNLYALLQYLPPRYRLVFNLFVLEGHTHPEIAKILGISVGTSKSNLFKARKRVQQLAPPYFLIDKQFSNG
ncbi:RNA polymerase sigma factor [Neolewinella antarctica]|uniref:RNA polymerase sigma factor n=1 Tax=Neolewinella antarctica TaxID=442734 RepID=A0ABX0XFW3_9BACT|nr:RNA polymerase sigma factor [Neolewinella antarctica]NJC27771.1 RNA polymerase sigma-70 factor (ECF subfamily) [Neolewinella antarctica]